MKRQSLLLFPLIFILLFDGQVKAGEKSAYDFSWLDPDKEVYVLQNRKYRKKGKFHINVGYGMTTSGAFVDATTIQGRVGYFFLEEFGIEAIYARNSGSENSAAESVRNNGAAGSTPFRRIVDDYKGGFIVWSPFYAKINTFNKIIYLDWMLGIGYGQLKETNNREDIQRPIVSNPQEKQETHNALMWETALQFYLSKYFNIRVDLTGVHYQAQKALSTSDPNDKSYYSNYDLSLSLGLNF